MTIKINDLATQVAEQLKKQIEAGKVETSAKAVEAAKAAVTEALAGEAKNLQAAITADVLQRIPKGAVYTPGGAKGFDPELGLASMGKGELKALRDRVLFAMAPKMFEGADAKAMSVQVGADGGYLVPEEFIAEVQRKLVFVSNFRSLARVFNGVGLKGSIPRETGTVTAAYFGEAKSITLSAPTLGALTWGLSKRAARAQLTRELFRMSDVDVLGLLATMFAEQFQLLDSRVYLTGSGSGQPMGLRTQTTGMGSLAIAGSTLNWKDLVRLKHAVASQYRNEAGSCAFMAHNDVISKIAQLVDDQNRPIFIDRGPQGMGGPNIPPQTVGFVLGMPLVENPYAPTNLGAGSASEIYFGNFKRGYVIFDAGTMETKTSEETGDAFETDTIYTKATAYDDGKPAIPEALAILTGVL